MEFCSYVKVKRGSRASKIIFKYMDGPAGVIYI